VQERDVVLVEDLEELVPGNLLEALLLLAEVEPKNAAASLSGAHDGWAAAALLGPASDLVVLGGGGCLAHRILR
jgi:hypothetical protein